MEILRRGDVERFALVLAALAAAGGHERMVCRERERRSAACTHGPTPAWCFFGALTCRLETRARCGQPEMMHLRMSQPMSPPAMLPWQ